MANNRELSQFASVVGYNGGNIGIGTDSMSSALQIYAADTGEGTAKGQITLKDTAAYNQTPTGGIVFQGHHTTGAQAIFAGIRGFKANSGNGDYDGCLAFDVRKHGAVAYEAMRINEDGEMGVGLASPNSNLHVKGGSESTDNLLLTLQSDGVANDGSLSTGLRLINSTSDTSIHGVDIRAIRTGSVSDDLTFSLYNGSASQVERLRITSAGKIGIGTDNPQANLHLFEGTGSTQAPAASGNNLVVDGSGEVGMSLLFGTTASTAYGNIYWGNSTDGSADGRITYFGSTYATAADRQSMVIRTAGSERLRITSDGHLVYDTNKGGIYNFDKACSANASTNIFRIQNSHGAHCFTIYMTGSNSGNSVSKIYHVACQYGSNPTISSAADTGGYSSNNFSLTGSESGSTHTFAISVTGAAATISCTVVLGSMNTSGTVTVL